MNILKKIFLGMWEACIVLALSLFLVVVPLEIFYKVYGTISYIIYIILVVFASEVYILFYDHRKKCRDELP